MATVNYSMSIQSYDVAGFSSDNYLSFGVNDEYVDSTDIDQFVLDLFTAIKAVGWPGKPDIRCTKDVVVPSPSYSATGTPPAFSET